MDLDIVLNSTGIMPTISSEGAAGYDVYADLGASGRETQLLAGDDILVSVGFKMKVPKGFGAFLLPRSGLGSKGLVLGNLVGLIDSDYRGEVMACMWNRHQTRTHTIKHGERIAQMVIAPVLQFRIREVLSLDVTARGDGGFGSTGT